MSKSLVFLTPVLVISGFSMGCGLGAVDSGAAEAAVGDHSCAVAPTWRCASLDTSFSMVAVVVAVAELLFSREKCTARSLYCVLLVLLCRWEGRQTASLSCCVREGEGKKGVCV